MTIRGVRKPDSLCTTSAMRGVFRDNQSTRTELMALIYGGAVTTMLALFCLRLAAGMLACLLLLSPAAGQPALLPHPLPDRPGPGRPSPRSSLRDGRRLAAAGRCSAPALVLSPGRLAVAGRWRGRRAAAR